MSDILRTTLARLADGRKIADEDIVQLCDRITELEAALRGLMPTALHYGGLRDCDLAAIKEARAALAGGKDE